MSVTDRDYIARPFVTRSPGQCERCGSEISEKDIVFWVDPDFAEQINEGRWWCEFCWMVVSYRLARGDYDPSCTSCGTRFIPSRKDARYCSNACRQRAYRKRAT